MDLRVRVLVHTLVRYVLATAVMVVLVVRVRLASTVAGAWIVLDNCGLTGFIVYASSLILCRPPAVTDLLSVVAPAGWRRRVFNSGSRFPKGA